MSGLYNSRIRKSCGSEIFNSPICNPSICTSQNVSNASPATCQSPVYSCFPPSSSYSGACLERETRTINSKNSARVIIVLSSAAETLVSFTYCHISRMSSNVNVSSNKSIQSDDQASRSLKENKCGDPERHICTRIYFVKNPYFGNIASSNP